MLEDMLGAYGNRLTIAVIGVAVGFLCLILVLWLMRGRGGPAPFLRGGKNRQPRLQVLDAAAVDARRRLVLVRRDDVEHLVMIGGPTDIVIESSIVDGRSPPYHTTMKTVSAVEPDALGQAGQAPVEERADMNAGRLGSPASVRAQAAEPAEAPERPPAARPPEQRPVPPMQDGRRPIMATGQPIPLAPATVPLAPPSALFVSTPAVEPVAPPSSMAGTAPVLAAADRVTTPAAEPTPMPQTPPPVRTPVTEPVVSRQPDHAVRAPEPRLDAGASGTTAAGISAPTPAATSAPAVRDTVFAPPDPTVSPIEPSTGLAPPPIASRPSRDPASLDDAVDLLDAARERVFQQARIAPASSPLPSRPTPVGAPPAASAPAVAPGKPLGSDFERILEEEMAHNLSAANTGLAGAAGAVGPAGVLPRREPTIERAPGAIQEPALQNEIARIFGEMSATREDR